MKDSNSWSLVKFKKDYLIQFFKVNLISSLIQVSQKLIKKNKKNDDDSNEAILCKDLCYLKLFLHIERV